MADRVKYSQHPPRSSRPTSAATPRIGTVHTNEKLSNEGSYGKRAGPPRSLGIEDTIERRQGRSLSLQRRRTTSRWPPEVRHTKRKGEGKAGP
jgi:hypothetical protein